MRAVVADRNIDVPVNDLKNGQRKGLRSLDPNLLPIKYLKISNPNSSKCNHDPESDHAQILVVQGYHQSIQSTLGASNTN